MSGDGVDTERANAARMYDYMLGGGHNFAVDREQVAKVVAGNPDVAHWARSNRAFLGRVVRWCTAHGVEQFLDLGSGVPTVGNVHEIAGPAARVAYVEVEPVAVAYSREIVAGLDTVTITQADLRSAGEVLAAPGVAGLLDFALPVAVLAVGVLHFVPGDLGPVLAAYRAALAPGSVVAISHASDDQDDDELADRVRGAGRGYRGSASEATFRSRDELRALVTGLEIAPPGLVDVVEWPDPAAPRGARVGGYGLVATVPAGG